MHSHLLPRPHFATFLALAGILLCPSLGHGQVPSGTGKFSGAITTIDGMAVGGAYVRLAVQTDGRYTHVIGESDDDGRVLFNSIPTGSGWLYARRIGFRPDSIAVHVTSEGGESVMLGLERIVIELDAVRILGRHDLNGPMSGFYRRMQTNGGGRFLTASELERRNARNMTDVFRGIPGMRIESNGMLNRLRVRNSMCAPLVWLDGQPLFAGEVDLDAFDPRTFEGIEVYSGPASVPPEFHGNQRMSSACGTILLWSKHGETRPKKRKKDEPTPAALIARLVEQHEAFVVGEVDMQAKPDSSSLIKPVYPDSLFDVQAGGEVLAEFVVDITGRARMDTFSAVTTSHRLFVEPVRRAVQFQEFIPATRSGKVVPQVMQLPFQFVPDSTARRRD